MISVSALLIQLEEQKYFNLSILRYLEEKYFLLDFEEADDDDNDDDE